jgi:surface carbohydrate biosynthesis protein
MYRILIFTDSKYRDLPSSVLLKHTIQREYPDSTIVICSFNIWQQSIETFSPHLVILTHILGKRNKAIASYVRRNGGSVAVLFTEGIIEFKGKEAVFSAQKDSDYVDLFLCWNKEVAKLLGSKAVSVGSPRFDFYEKPLNSLIDSRGLFCDKYNLDYDRPILLMGDSWPSSKFKYSLKSFHRSDWKDLGNVKADKWADPDKFAEDQYAMQEQFKLYALAVIDAFPNIQVVIKSHPMSDFRRWSKWSSEHGVTLVHGEYVFNALNACDAYAAKTGSITIAEAWLLDKVAIKIGYEYDSASSKEQFDTDTWCANNIGLFVDLAGDAVLGNGAGASPVDDGHTEYLKKWGMLRRGSSAKTVTKKIGELLEGARPIREPRLINLKQAMSSHDMANIMPVVDGFGNFDKAITSQDVIYWYNRIAKVI